MRELNLLTAIGVSPKKSTYKLDGRVSEGSSSASALINVLAEKPTKVFLLLTEKTMEEPYIIFKEEIGDIEVQELFIPNGANSEEVQAILQTILEAIPDDSRLIMDITGGLRHFPFLFFVSALFIQSFKNVQIDGIYYGMFEEKDEDGNCKHIDLKILLEIADWFHAVKSFSEQRHGNALTSMATNAISEPKTDNEKRVARELSKLIKQIELFDIYYGTGLPLGIGDCSKSFCDQLSNKREKVFPDEKSEFIPLGPELFDYAAGSMKSFVLPNEMKTTGQWKNTFVLTLEEISRQANIIDDYFHAGQYSNAVRLMREWIISRCVLSCTADKGAWLDKKERSRINNQLGSIRWQLEKKILQNDKTHLASLWDSTISFRNIVAHNEMTSEDYHVDIMIDKIEDCWETMKEKMNMDEFWIPFTGGGGGKLLITPLGFSKGLMYSALELVHPDKCLIVTSSDAMGAIEEILDKAEYRGEVIGPLVLNDPFTGFGEIKVILDSVVKEHAKVILGSDEVIVNLTGGTTTLQILAEEISNKAWQMGKDPKRVVIFDTRTVMVQKEDPFIVGQMKDYNEIIQSKNEKSDEDGNDRS